MPVDAKRITFEAVCPSNGNLFIYSVKLQKRYTIVLKIQSFLTLN